MRWLAGALMVGYIALFVPPFRLVALAPLSANALHAALLGGAALKAAPILLMASNAAAQRATPLAAGLLLSSLGDVALDLHEVLNVEPLFPAGLACFLAAHIAYIYWITSTFRSPPQSLGAGLAFTLLPILMLRVLWAGLPANLHAPVAVYAVVISLFGYRACVAHGAPSSLAAGALTFLVSDTILAVNQFGPPAIRTPGVAKLAVMLTYYAAQGMLARAGHGVEAGRTAAAAVKRE